MNNQPLDNWLERLRSRRKTGVKPTPAAKLAYVQIEKRELTPLEATNYIAREMQDALIKQGKNPKLIFHPNNLPLMEEIALNVISPKEKGIFLLGDNSAGKSFALLQSFKAINKLSYTGRYTNTPKTTIYDYEYLMQSCQDAKGLSPLYKMVGDIALDDLGYNNESNINIMGTKVNFLVKVVYHLHKHYMAGNKVSFTSNLTLDFIQGNYGKGTRDRIEEMTTVRTWKQLEKGFRTKTI